MAPRLPKEKERVKNKDRGEAAREDEGEKTETVLNGRGARAATPADPIPSKTLPSAGFASISQKPAINLVPEYDSDSDAEGETKDPIEVTSLSSMDLPKAQSSMTRGEERQAVARAGSSLMGPPESPASATRGMRKDVVAKDAGTQTSDQGKKFWSMEDLPEERYTMDGHRIR